MVGLEAVGQSYALMPYWRSARIKIPSPPYNFSFG